MNNSSSDILREAFEQAKTIFSEELTRDECKRIWITTQPSFDDLKDTVANTLKSYDNKTLSDTRKWLHQFSSKIIYYGNVLDVLAQHHPEYVSLAWGAFKFLFIVSLFSWRTAIDEKLRDRHRPSSTTKNTSRNCPRLYLRWQTFYHGASCLWFCTPRKR